MNHKTIGYKDGNDIVFACPCGYLRVNGEVIRQGEGKAHEGSFSSLMPNLNWFSVN